MEQITQGREWNWIIKSLTLACVSMLYSCRNIFFKSSKNKISDFKSREPSHGTIFRSKVTWEKKTSGENYFISQVQVLLASHAIKSLVRKFSNPRMKNSAAHSAKNLSHIREYLLCESCSRFMLSWLTRLSMLNPAHSNQQSFDSFEGGAQTKRGPNTNPNHL